MPIFSGALQLIPSDARTLSVSLDPALPSRYVALARLAVVTTTGLLPAATPLIISVLPPTLTSVISNEVIVSRSGSDTVKKLLNGTVNPSLSTSQLVEVSSGAWFIG